jgi:type III pantothenate kinase
MINYVIAVDVGNTNAHIGLINCTSRSILSLDIFPSTEIDTRLVNSLVTLSQSMKHAAPVPVVLSSVLPSLRGRFDDTLKKAVEGPVCWIHNNDRLPIINHYSDPGSLGPDRLANFLYGFTAFTGKSQIIISAGTTITVDYLKNGREFLGGAIVPGLTTQLKSLHDQTASLPEVESGEIDFEFPGLSTKSCMHSGVRFGIAGSLSFLVEKYRSHFDETSLVLTTGGSWKYVQDLVDFEFQFIPELTLVGCALYYALTGDQQG